MQALVQRQPLVLCSGGDNEVILTLQEMALKRCFKRSNEVRYISVDKRRFFFSQLAVRIDLFPKKGNPYLIDAPSVINVGLL